MSRCVCVGDTVTSESVPGECVKACTVHINLQGSWWWRHVGCGLVHVPSCLCPFHVDPAERLLIGVRVVDWHECLC